MDNPSTGNNVLKLHNKRSILVVAVLTVSAPSPVAPWRRVPTQGPQ
jgi:hypothetical protein